MLIPPPPPINNFLFFRLMFTHSRFTIVFHGGAVRLRLRWRRRPDERSRFARFMRVAQTRRIRTQTKKAAATADAKRPAAGSAAARDNRTNSQAREKGRGGRRRGGAKGAGQAIRRSKGLLQRRRPEYRSDGAGTLTSETGVGRGPRFPSNANNAAQAAYRANGVTNWN